MNMVVLAEPIAGDTFAVVSVPTLRLKREVGVGGFEVSCVMFQLYSSPNPLTISTDDGAVDNEAEGEFSCSSSSARIWRSKGNDMYAFEE